MKLSNIIEVTKASHDFTGKDRVVKRIVTSSQAVKRGDLFIALKGKVYDGHHYIKEAIERGARYIICSEKPIQSYKGVVFLQVMDTTQALIELGRFQRSQFPIPLIAITGSVGKTMTKELIYRILKQRYTVLKSPKNYNNRIGVPLTLLELNSHHQMIVMELGMNHSGEIHELSELCEPDIGVITNIGTSHIGYLKGKKQILKAKLEITDGMQDGYLLVNGHDSYLKRIKKDDIEVISVGTSPNLTFSHVQLYVDSTFAWLHYQDQIIPMKIPMPGKKLLDNVLLAIQVGLLFQVPINDIVTAIESYHTKEGRLQFLELPNGITLIDDCYNASLESLDNALSILSLVEGPKTLVFGDILELGNYSKKIHKKAAKLMKQVPDLQVILVGSETKRIRKRLRNSTWFPDVKSLLETFDITSLIGQTVLVKGSRGIHLDRFVSSIQKTT